MAIKLVVAGWRGVTMARHGELINAGLWQVLGDLHERFDEREVTLLIGDNPHGGVDAVVTALVGQGNYGPGWRVESRRHQRQERIPGSGHGNYRLMFADGDVDLLVLFPGPNDADSREALMWACRAGTRFVGFPIPTSKWSKSG